MPHTKIIIFAVLFLFMAGCDWQHVRKGVCEGMYEVHVEDGRNEDWTHNTPRERANRPDMSYDQYMQERKERIGNDSHRE